MTLLATFLHLADLHIGELDPMPGHATLSAAQVALANSKPHFQGMVGHHARGLEEVEALYRLVRPVQGEFRLIVTGDITRCGRPAEFDVAHDFLFGSLKLPSGLDVGLKLPAHEFIGVPGNHDHWNGGDDPIGAGPTDYFSPARTWTPETPIAHVVPMPDDKRVVLVCIDSDRDVTSTSVERLMAIGEFQSQIYSPSMPSFDFASADVRLLLAHHSSAARGKTLRMGGRSRSALYAHLRANGYLGLMTGHVKHFKLPKASMLSKGGTDEFRCGSSAKHDEPPADWFNLGGTAPARPWKRNTALLHRIRDRDGQLVWESQAYGRLANGGFRPLGAQQDYMVSV